MEADKSAIVSGEHPVQPGEFISIAEETGQIVPPGRQVLENALATLSELRKRGLNPGHCVVNVAAAQLKAGDYPDTVRSLLERRGLFPDDLKIEITENIPLDRSSDLVARAINALSEMGVRIALDDFGTGYASLAHLKPFRIDRSRSRSSPR